MARPTDTGGIATWASGGAWLLTSHLISMSIGLLGLPILMSSLELLQFGAWAVLLGGTFAFSTLELGMSSAVMRWTTLALTPHSNAGSETSISAIMSNSLVCASLAFGIASIPLYMHQDMLANWLNLPTTGLMSGGQCIMLVYATVALLALLRCTIAPLLATRRVASHARFTLLQASVTAGATWSAALWTKRLDYVLFANTVAIVVVQSAVAFRTRQLVPWRFDVRLLDLSLARTMLGYGAALQFSAFCGFVMYQFDKLLISAVVAPTEVAHYEIASRSAQALGNISNAPLVAFAPDLVERHGKDEDSSDELLRMLRVTVIGIGVFLLLPLSVAPIGLFAWVGQTGYHAAHVFVILALSAIITTLTWPLSMCAQAKGQASKEMWRATAAMLINIPAAYALIHAFGKEGAALGTLLACVITSGFFAFWVLRTIGLRWARMWRALAPLLMPIAAAFTICALLAAVIEPLVIRSRWYMAPAAATIYASGLLMILALLARPGRLSAEERWVLKRAPLLGRLFKNAQSEHSTPAG